MFKLVYIDRCMLVYMNGKTTEKLHHVNAVAVPATHARAHATMPEQLQHFLYEMGTRARSRTFA